MQLAFAHLLMLVCGIGTGWYGWFMAHNPERVHRLFTFGAAPEFGKRFFVSWNRAVGWCFTVFGGVVVADALFLLAVDLLTAVERTSG